MAVVFATYGDFLLTRFVHRSGGAWALSSMVHASHEDLSRHASSLLRSHFVASLPSSPSFRRPRMGTSRSYSARSESRACCGTEKEATPHDLTLRLRISRRRGARRRPQTCRDFCWENVAHALSSFFAFCGGFRLHGREGRHVVWMDGGRWRWGREALGRQRGWRAPDSFGLGVDGILYLVF